jgi:large-conductance mechanosensitive channel
VPIITSIVLWDQPQTDGRRYIRERHTDQLGVVQFRDYLAAVGVVIADGFPAIVALLNQALIDQEIQRNLAEIYEKGQLAVVRVQYASAAENGAAARLAYKTATREQVMALGAYLNTLSNVTLGNLFGLAGAALTAFRTRLQTKATQWAEYLAQAGE